MPDIFHDFPIKAPVSVVFQAMTTPEGLDSWWTQRAERVPGDGTEYLLSFGPGYAWTGQVLRSVPEAEFEMRITKADSDWTGTVIRIRLEPEQDRTWVRFCHAGWPECNEHYRVSCNCWAAYLRVLRRSLEHGESVPYEIRLDV